jgi:hypothetical protein
MGSIEGKFFLYIKCFLFSLLLLLSPVLLWAQWDDAPAELEWGARYSESRGSRVTKVVEVTPDAYYVLRQRPAGTFSYPKVFIEQYNAEQKLVRSQPLELKYKGKRRAFQDVVKIGGRLYFFTSFLNEAQKINYLFYQTLNNKLLPSRKLTKVSQVPAANEGRPGNFNLLVSQDSSKVLIYSQLDSRNKEPKRFSLHVFDDQMQPIWDKKVTLPYNERQFEVEDYRLDDEGNVYLLGRQYLNGRRESRAGRANYQYNILAYVNSGEDKQEYRVEVGDKFISDLTFRRGNNGELVCAGFYSEQAADGAKGTCFFRINLESRKVYNVNFKEFDFGFRAQGLSGAKVRRAQRAEQENNQQREAELFRYSLDRLILRSDGGAVLVAEQYYVTEQFQRFQRNPFFWGDPYMWNDPMLNNQTDFVFHYNDIIVVNIRPDGSIEWASRIPKYQRTMNDGGYFSSYSMAVVKDRLYFVFNDNSRNFESDGSTQLFNYNPRRSVIAIAELRKDGELSMYPLLSNQQSGIIARPKICRQVGSRRMVLYGERGRFYRFGELTFEK